MSGPIVPLCLGIGLPVALKGMSSQVWFGVGIRGLKVDVEPPSMLPISFLSKLTLKVFMKFFFQGQFSFFQCSLRFLFPFCSLLCLMAYVGSALRRGHCHEP